MILIPHFRLKTLLFLVFIPIYFQLACTKTEQPVIPEPVEKYKQYSTPFDQVPDAAEVILYEVNLRAFGPDRNLQAVKSRLDEIKKLGINVVWLMPIHPIGQINSVNSPYSVKDYTAVNAEFGTLADLRQLTDAAHEKGIAIMMDWVANHTSWDNPWISDKNWYTQDASGNIIHPAGTNWQDVADLNYDNSNMRAAMIDAMKFWVLEANVDGFRCDYADGVPYDFWKQAIDSLRMIPDRKLIFFAEGNRTNHFNAGFDLNFGWGFYSAIKDVYKGQSAARIFTAHQSEYNNIPVGKHWVRFTTNHDESAWDATPVTLFNGINGALSASVITIFTGGVPLIYGSQEVGTAQTVPFFTPSSINWTANPALLASYQKILQFYASSKTAKTGTSKVYSHTDIACLKKSDAESELLLMVNVRNQQVSYPVPAELKNSSWINVMNDQTIQLGDQLSFNAFSFYVLKKQ
ncbi:MAG TPA: alpha-amylase family glycosyl hydrolase [Saprospiraceae bacterium]|nr:alpha-amylase [Saprospirales bacterium]HRQ29742.1 alpha-amylase family glycosyl hydrolase [Saprospiraceae bacterium]